MKIYYKLQNFAIKLIKKIRRSVIMLLWLSFKMIGYPNFWKIPILILAPEIFFFTVET